MFGRLGTDGQIDRAKLDQIDEAVGLVAGEGEGEGEGEEGKLGAGAGARAGRNNNRRRRPLREMVPRVVRAGEIAGVLSAAGSSLLGGLPQGTPVAAPEGDQQAALVGAGVGELEMALSAGTSFTANLVTSARLKAESETFNILHAADGDSTMVMICARNGTIGFAEYVRGLADLAQTSFEAMADRITAAAADLPADAHGCEIVPFFQGENVAELPEARASFHHLGMEFLSKNPAVMARLLLEGPCMTLRYGIERLRSKLGGDLRRVVLSGGALKSQGGFAPQLFADVLGVPVVARSGDEVRSPRKRCA